VAGRGGTPFPTPDSAGRGADTVERLRRC